MSRPLITDPETIAYNAGVYAQRDGLRESDCPYLCNGGAGQQRVSWFDGFYDEKFRAKYGRLFREYGIEWP